VVAVSTNLLAVSLSALLIEQPTTLYFPMAATASFLPKFNGNPIQATGEAGELYEHYYVALANLTYNTSLPPWLDHSNCYLPFSLDTPQSLQEPGSTGVLQDYQGTTTDLALTLIAQIWSQGRRLMVSSSALIKAELRPSFQLIIFSPTALLSLVYHPGLATM
jgi:hypothetical protein